MNIYEFTREQEYADFRILEDCYNIIKSTSNLDTFESRYNHLFLVLDRMGGQWGNGVAKVRANVKSEFPELLGACVERTIDNINSMKTPKGRNKRRVDAIEILKKVNPNTLDASGAEAISKCVKKFESSME